MKNRKLLFILTLFEIISFIGLCITIPFILKLEQYNTIYDLINILKNLSFSPIFIINLFKIFIVLFILSNLIRFIFIRFELKMIFLASIVISIGMIYLYLSDKDSLILKIITLLALIICFVGIIYTHIVDRNK